MLKKEKISSILVVSILIVLMCLFMFITSFSYAWFSVRETNGIQINVNIEGQLAWNVYQVENSTNRKLSDTSYIKVYENNTEVHELLPDTTYTANIIIKEEENLNLSAYLKYKIEFMTQSGVNINANIGGMDSNFAKIGSYYLYRNSGIDAVLPNNASLVLMNNFSIPHDEFIKLQDSESIKIVLTIDAYNLADWTNMNNLTTGKYLTNTGAEGSNESWSYTDYIAVDGYSFTLKRVAGNAPSICAYNENKELITAVAYNTGNTARNVTIKSDTKISYIRFSVNKDWTSSNAILVKNETENLNPTDWTTLELNYNKYKLNTDELYTDSQWAHTPMIEVDGYSFTLKNVSGNSPAICAYDENGEFIKGVNYGLGTSGVTGDVTITSDVKIGYIVYSVKVASATAWDGNNAILIKNY